MPEPVRLVGVAVVEWFTDAISGFVYGALVLAAVILALRTVIGPASGREAT